MSKFRFRKGSWILIPALLVVLFPFNNASASTYTATQDSRDFNFEISVPQTLTVRAYAWEQSRIDSMLWLYDNNNLIAANDDWYGLDSNISIELQPGTYRLRAGVCCGNPDAWYGTSYTIEANLAPTNVSTTTTTVVTTTTIPPLPENQIWLELNEGGSQEFSAPDGYVFSNVIFASYGTPNGSDGYYEVNNDCHAQNSLSIIEDVLIGNNSGTITASNNVFGDPCGGVYKRLFILAEYSPEEPTTTTSTTTTTTTTTVPQTTSTTSTTTSTTTIPETTSSTSTTTTLPPQTTTTTIYTPSTTIPPTTTTSTTTTSTTTTTTSTTTTVPETTTIPTTTILQTTTTTIPITTTIAPSTTILITTSTVLPTTTTSPQTTTTIPTTTTVPPTEIAPQSAQEAVTAILNSDLASAPVEQLKEVFAAIDVSDLSQEQVEELVNVLNEQDDEIKETLEEEINVYGGGFDNYVPAGSNIDVGTRKTVIAAAAALAAITIAPSTGAGPSGGTSGGSGGGGGNGGSGGEARSRREEEGGDEPAGEIAGPEDNDGEDYAKNSIFNYYIKEGFEMKKFNWFGFGKKLWDITTGLAFTLAGSFVVYITLSGTTQRLAGIATLVAIFMHYLSEILKNDTN